MWITIAMKTIQMTIDEKLLKDADKLIAELETNRSAFIRDLIKAELRKRRQRELERRDAEGYRKHPQKPEEFAIDEKARDWGDDW